MGAIRDGLDQRLRPYDINISVKSILYESNRQTEGTNDFNEEALKGLNLKAKE